MTINTEIPKIELDSPKDQGNESLVFLLDKIVIKTPHYNKNGYFEEFNKDTLKGYEIGIQGLKEEIPQTKILTDIEIIVDQSKIKFKNLIIQEKGFCLSNLIEYFSESNLNIAKEFILDLINLERKILKKGFIYSDPIFSNYIVSKEGEILLHDLGEITKDKTTILNGSSHPYFKPNIRFGYEQRLNSIGEILYNRLFLLRQLNPKLATYYLNEINLGYNLNLNFEIQDKDIHDFKKEIIKSLRNNNYSDSTIKLFSKNEIKFYNCLRKESSIHDCIYYTIISNKFNEQFQKIALEFLKVE